MEKLSHTERYYRRLLNKYFSKPYDWRGTGIDLDSKNTILAGRIIEDGDAEIIVRGRTSDYQIKLRDNKLMGLVRIVGTLHDRLDEFRKDGWVNEKEIQRMVLEAL